MVRSHVAHKVIPLQGSLYTERACRMATRFQIRRRRNGTVLKRANPHTHHIQRRIF